jgi:succinate dehydrogenase/fumarate reductase-like Fe-S protein
MSNDKQQTAVEWLVKELNQKIDFIPLEKWDMIRDIIQQAKEMEKKQIKNAFINGYLDSYNAQNNINADEIFYQKTYGGNK